MFARPCVYGRNCPQPFARGRYGRAYGKFCERDHSWRFQTSSRVASFRVAGVALNDIPTCLITCRKSFSVAGAILLRRFLKMSCISRGRRSTLETIIVMSHGRRSPSDVSCGSSFANRIVRAASSGDNVQIPWQARHFVRCAEN